VGHLCCGLHFAADDSQGDSLRFVLNYEPALEKAKDRLLARANCPTIREIPMALEATKYTKAQMHANSSLIVLICTCQGPSFTRRS